MKPILFNTEMVKAILEGRKTVTRRVIKADTAGMYAGKCALGAGMFDIKTNQRVIYPPYKVNDILYVRETWNKDKTALGYRYYADWEKDGIADITKWKPSIHMPKEAARIFLRITNVRVERLQDIKAQGIRDEGLTSMAVHCGDMDIAKEEFKILWNSTIKKAQLKYYSWEANPYVWVIEFEKLEEVLNENISN